MTRVLRVAQPEDALAIHGIYAPVVEANAISFELEPPSVEEVAGRIRHYLESHPWLVLELEGQIAGYAYASVHRARAAYQWSTEVSVYVHPGFHRQGVGRALYQSLFALLRLQGFRLALAGITSPNPASEGIHQSLGFQLVGVYPNIGYKLGEWRDVSWWWLDLGGVQENPAVPSRFPEILRHPGFQEALQSGLPLLKEGKPH